jgi:hypothetical protein
MNNTLEQFLKVKGYNRTNITHLINASPPTTRLIMENPLQLKVSQVVSIAKATKVTFQEVAGLIIGTHHFANYGENVRVIESEKVV